MIRLLVILLLLATPVYASGPFLLAGILKPLSAPSAPTSVSAAGGNTQNTITWTNGTGATSHNLLWDTVSHAVSGTYANTITGVTSPKAHTGLTNGTLYYYKVQAANGGLTANSSEVSAIPGYYSDTFDADAIASGVVPSGWTTVSGSATYGSIISNPDGPATDHVFQVHDTTTTESLNIKKLWTATAIKTVLMSVRAGQTNMTGGICIGINQTINLAWGADGHFKYHNGTALVNLPTDTTYAANTWYDIKATLDYTAKQATFYVNNVNKGTVSFGDTNATEEQGIQFNAKNTSYSENGLFMWNNVACLTD